MFRIVVLLLCALSVRSLHAEEKGLSLDLSRDGIQKWLCQDPTTCIEDFDALPAATIAERTLRRLKEYLSRVPSDPSHGLHKLLSRQKTGLTNMTHPYFAFIPMPLGTVTPGKSITTVTKCFDQVTISAVWNGTDTIVVTFDMVGQKSVLCTDTLLAVTGGGSHLQVADVGSVYKGVIKIAKPTPTVKWFVDHHGIMLFIEPLSLLDAIGSIIDTITLMSGYFENPIGKSTIDASISFLRDYVQISPRMQPRMVPRPSGSAVIKRLDPQYINSGDLILVMRPDGLDPMIGWGEGSTVGHSTIAIRTSPTDLLVCESTTADAYWPTNGVQCTPWATWADRVVKADMNVDLVPLSKKASALFDTKAAMAFFEAHRGLDYGFSTFIFGWIDTMINNFPCVPPSYTTCLTPQSVLMVAMLVDDLLGSQPQNIFRQGVAHRVGLWPKDATVLESLQHAVTQLGMKSFADVYVKPEMDSWVYNTTRNGTITIGKSMVCCVFVCNMWKAGGLFSSIGDDIQCGEQTLWDIYSMQLFDPAKMGAGRPEVCQKYDPENPLCQLTGNTTLHILPDLNTRPLYKGMGEKCSSKCPNYVREAGC